MNRPQDLEECDDEVPVGDGADYLLSDEFLPRCGALRRAGRAEPPQYGERAQVAITA